MRTKRAGDLGPQSPQPPPSPSPPKSNPPISRSPPLPDDCFLNMKSRKDYSQHDREHPPRILLAVGDDLRTPSAEQQLLHGAGPSIRITSVRCSPRRIWW